MNTVKNQASNSPYSRTTGTMKALKVVIASVLVLAAVMVSTVVAQGTEIRVDTTLGAVAGGILAGIAWASLGYLDGLRKTTLPPEQRVFDPKRFLRTVALGAVLGFFIDFSAPLGEEELVTALTTLVSTAGILPIVQKVLGVVQLGYSKINPPATPPPA